MIITCMLETGRIRDDHMYFDMQGFLSELGKREVSFHDNLKDNCTPKS